MKTLISETLLSHNNSPSSPSLSRFYFRSINLKNRFFLQFPNRRWSSNSKTPNFCSISTSTHPTSISSNFGGWDDLKLIEHPNQNGKLNKVQSFLVSLGIDDSKQVFMFILGLVSALAISRVRVSTILVFPATVLIFGIGFSMGFVRGGGVGFLIEDITRFRSKNGSKEENSRGYAEKLRNSVDFFNELNTKIANLEKEMKGAMNSNFVQVGELESYHNELKSISLDIIREKNEMEASTDSSREAAENEEVGTNSNSKSIRRKSDDGMSFFDFLGFIGGLFKHKPIVSKPGKVKDTAKREVMEELNSRTANNQIHGIGRADRNIKENVLDQVSKNGLGNMQIGTSSHEGPNKATLKQHGGEMVVEGEMEEVPVMSKRKSVDSLRNIRSLLDDEEYYSESNSQMFLKNQRNFIQKAYRKKNEMPYSRDSFRDRMDMGLGNGPRELDEYTFKKSNQAYIPNSRNNSINGTSKYDLREKGEAFGDGLDLENIQIASDTEEISKLSSSVVSEDVEFDRHLTDATSLLKQAKECLKGSIDEEKAEVLLYKSARLLSKAISMKPMSLLAVGQLGNTFLLHGELKLKISRELRSLLLTGEEMHRKREDRVISKDKILSSLIDVCEECEELLVEAGKKYRMALSIDGSDARALYNWGLSLSYRAQLVSDIGPEAAFDADKMYLAAIDKFDAMMSKSNAYAPDALYRWGVALRQRSQLRRSNSREKMTLLLQARRLLEDSLEMDSNNDQVREALSSCISEISYWNI